MIKITKSFCPNILGRELTTWGIDITRITIRSKEIDLDTRIAKSGTIEGEFDEVKVQTVIDVHVPLVSVKIIRQEDILLEPIIEKRFVRSIPSNQELEMLRLKLGATKIERIT